MSSAEHIKESYERFPYPGNDLAALIEGKGSLPALSWMQGIGRPGCVKPQRVLVAGCGTGVEAFLMRSWLPHAEIVAMDFSPRSIAVARQLEKKAKVGRPITFLVGDLTDVQLARKIGRQFDLITCHGVLSYIPEPGRALKVLATCMAADGALYLGVNGAGHPTVALRPWLKSFGVVVDELRDERRVRELLQLWDTLHDDELGEQSTMPSSYLASDVCGGHFNNWPLARWRRAARRTGWEVAGTAVLAPALHIVADDGKEKTLYPAGIGELAERLDQIRPAGFHRIMLRRAKAAVAIWCWTGIYTVKFGATSARFYAASQGIRFEAELTPPQIEALKILVKAKFASESWAKPWTRNDAGRRTLWLWAGLGVVAEW
ncbi:MAG: class I SAM-dependent methyltransferase [Undibacterium sp.]|nr:class I SAM-dependent methyltransferase [Opitutaceae bacterium]